MRTSKSGCDDGAGNSLAIVAVHGVSMQQTILKWLALKAPAQWPKGVQTRPEMEQGKGGTPPKDFALDKATLLATVRTFCEQLPAPPAPHPIVGRMTAADWTRWGYLHADHHLRQFGR